MARDGGAVTFTDAAAAAAAVAAAMSDGSVQK